MEDKRDLKSLFSRVISDMCARLDSDMNDICSSIHDETQFHHSILENKNAALIAKEDNVYIVDFSKGRAL